MQANNSCNFLCLFSWYFSYPYLPSQLNKKNTFFQPFFFLHISFWPLHHVRGYISYLPPQKKKQKNDIARRFKLHHPLGWFFIPGPPRLGKEPSSQRSIVDLQPRVDKATVTSKPRDEIHLSPGGTRFAGGGKLGIFCCLENLLNLKGLEVLKNVNHESNWIQQPALVKMCFNNKKVYPKKWPHQMHTCWIWWVALRHMGFVGGSHQLCKQIPHWTGDSIIRPPCDGYVGTITKTRNGDGEVPAMIR